MHQDHLQPTRTTSNPPASIPGFAPGSLSPGLLCSLQHRGQATVCQRNIGLGQGQQVQLEQGQDSSKHPEHPPPWGCSLAGSCLWWGFPGSSSRTLACGSRDCRLLAAPPLIPSNDLMSNLFYVTVLTFFFLLAAGLLNKVCLMICSLLLTLNIF